MQTAAERLVADLDEVLIGDLAPFRSGLSTSPVPGDISSDALLLPKQVDAILAWYDAKLGCRTDRRPALSIWMGWHFQAVLPILLAANVLLDRSPDLAFDRVRFALSSDLKATAIVVGPNVEQLTGVDGLERFAPLVHGYLAPLICLAASRGGITERVLWSNAGHIFERVLGRLGASSAGRPGLAAAQKLLATRLTLDGLRNPLFEPVRYIDGQRLRRVCCMRYLFPDGKICLVCPLRLGNPTRSTVHA